MRLQSKKRRALALMTAFAGIATMGMVSTASADLGTGSTLTPSTGINTPTTSMTLGLTAPSNACQGDSSTGGYRWNMYVAAAAVDPATLSLSGGVVVAPGGAYASTLFTPGGSPQVNRNTATGTGQITGLQAVNLENSGIPGNGVYNVGFICTLAGATTRHWISGTFTVANWTSSTNFNWGAPAAPVAPAGSTAAGGDGVITGTVASVAAIPAVSGYTVTATRTGGLADPASPRVLSVPASGAYSLAAQNGTTYSVAVTATNSVNTGPATTISNVAVNFTPVSPAPVLQVANGPSPINAIVNASTGTPPAGVTLVNTVLTVTPQGAAPAMPGSPFPVTGASGPVSLTGPAGSSYDYSIVSNYSDGRQSVVGNGSFSFTSAQVIIQDIQVVRPQGALVLTQRCGVFGSLPAYTDNVFGSLAALPAVPADADTVGSTPQNPAGPTAPTLGVGGASDPLAGQYPYPVDASGVPNANYPTNCAIDLGTGQLITSGPRAGQYFRANGRIAQVTVVNTRDADSGWTLNGRMSDFVSTTDATDTFSGNLLGWNPKVTWDSTANLDGYDMTVTAGGERQPEASASTTGLGAAGNSTNTTLAGSLAQSPAGSSLGIAAMDARLRLLIPVSADAGTYRGTLTFTTV